MLSRCLATPTGTLAVRVAGTPDTDWERLSPTDLWKVEYGLQQTVDALDMGVARESLDPPEQK